MKALEKLQIPRPPSSPLSFPSYRGLHDPEDEPSGIGSTEIPEEFENDDYYEGEGVDPVQDVDIYRYFMKRMKREMKKLGHNPKYSDLDYFTTKDGNEWAYWKRWKVAFPRKGDRVNFKVIGVVVNDYDDYSGDYFTNVLTSEIAGVQKRGNDMDYERPATKFQKPKRTKGYYARVSHPPIRGGSSIPTFDI